ncbi:hypothetical protein CYFUS_000347 [Cystobacter fuscus]|uniref:Uncharacterized protein n=1 Tax=Cystobacter fuscus TaxID=43 RepID=A0A250IT50_9BACT|nr:hypothetical protein [Cystobacter fuscus]ATB34935.1 hypothetical protein CYFUS_000347 [Cystobacter fuscus]
MLQWLMSAVGLGPPPPASGGPLTRETAGELVRWFMRTLGAAPGPGLNPQGFGGFAVGGAQVYFEYHEDRGALECSALVYRFNEPPRPGVIEGFEAEAREGTDTGGGSVDYERENRGLFLSREYSVVPEGAAFARDMKRLAKASLVWGDEVLDRVASRVFHPEELEKR